MSDGTKVFASVEDIIDAIQSLSEEVRKAQHAWVRKRLPMGGLTERLACYVLFSALARAFDPRKQDGIELEADALASLENLIDACDFKLEPAPKLPRPSLN